MTSLNIKNKNCKSIFNNRNIIIFFFISILFYYSNTLSNTYTIPPFLLSYDNVNDSNLTYLDSGIGLAIHYCDWIKMYGDSLENAANISYYPDVICWDKDSFSIYFVDTIQKCVTVENIRIMPNGKIISSSISRLFNINPPQDCYFHIDKGKCGFLASYIQKGNISKRYLQVNNGYLNLNVDSSLSTGWLFSSQTAMREDTFLVISTIDMNGTTLHKIYSCQNNLNIIGSAKVSTGSATIGNALMNCSVAIDSSGTICTAVLKGSPTGLKSLYVKFFNSSLDSIVDTLFTDSICDNSYYYYDDISISSIKSNQFLILFWDNQGIVLRTITLNGNNLTITDSRIVNNSGSKFCSLISNKNFLAAICKGDVNSDGVSGIEGILYTIDNNKNLTSPRIFTFSELNNALTIDNFSTSINSAIDDSGTITIVWRNGYRVAGSVWSHRCVKYSNGFYISKVEQISAPDSIRFLSSTLSVINKDACQVVDSVRIGSSVIQCTSAPWISLSDKNALKTIPLVNPFFQIKININRNNTNFIDSLTTPEIISENIHWDTKPSLIGIDSVNINNQNYNNIKQDDTITIFSRIDTPSLFIRAYEYDPLDSAIFVVSGILPSIIINRSDGNYYHGVITLPPFSGSNKIYVCTLAVKDLDDWYSTKQSLYFKPLNSVPNISTVITITGDSVNTLTIKNDTILIIQEEESINISYTVSDLNDPESVIGYIVSKNGSSSQKFDTLTEGKSSSFTLKADSITSTDTFFLSVIGKDIDTTTSLNTKLIINHAPVIERVVFKEQNLYKNDTLKAILDDTTLLTVFVDDPDCHFFDTLKYIILTHKSLDSLFTNSNNTSLKTIFEPEDSSFIIIVFDKFSRSDTFLLFLAYPWYDTSSFLNPQYASSKSLLTKGSSLIDGSNIVDTFFIPIVNSGRNDLNITGCKFISNSKEWLSVILDFDNKKDIVNSENYFFSSNISIKPFSSMRIAFLITARHLSGDSLLREEFILFTDDPKHKSDTFNIALEHNDLPKIISITPDFITNMPYKALSKSKDYFFPPHANISITFSEPIDSSSAVRGIQIYSINDTRQTGILETIPLRYSWFQNYTLLKVSPCYVKPSSYFNLLPPCGLFIPTDSLLIIISDNIYDKAATPSGPNHLDIDLNNIRNNGLDTSFSFMVDSINFTVISVTPPPSSIIGKKPRITLTFSAPIYKTFIDTSLINNHILTIFSHYSNNIPLPLEKIESDSQTISFTIGNELFYNDTLTCLYRSRYIKDKLGFSTDNNRNGIDATIFDSSSEEDNLIWGYRVKTISVASVEPLANAINKEDRPEIKITFDDKIPIGSFDTDTSNRNKSFRILSRNVPTSFSAIRLSQDSSTVILTPRSLFFSGDSVFCKFTGFTYNYNYNRIINLPEMGDSVFCSYEWSFISPKTGFYTYPNPYKPGREPRHCRNGGPCGIWFKNLHTLCDTLTEVVISIYSLNTHSIFDSRKAGIRIRFGKESQQSPQWLWDTKNNKGEIVGSGIYMYAICKVDGSLLKKGKLIIVR